MSAPFEAYNPYFPHGWNAARSPFDPLGQPYDFVEWLKEQQAGRCTCGKCGQSALRTEDQWSEQHESDDANEALVARVQPQAMPYHYEDGIVALDVWLDNSVK